jgi:hypothetical protein
MHPYPTFWIDARKVCGLENWDKSPRKKWDKGECRLAIDSIVPIVI